MESNNLTDIFGRYTFDNSVMRSRISKDAYTAFRRILEDGETLTIELANEVATALKSWAIELGATHYTHWFQPMTGATAEKHEAMISPDGMGGALLDLNGKALIKGEADASSFPSGGLRATFEARGYTTWDCTSPPFVRKDPGGSATLCIPTAFCSFTGEALDEKTPLLRSIEAVSRKSTKLLHIMGHKDVKQVIPTVGAEQEYFLIDKKAYLKRKDLIYAGRTLFGAPPAKGQELEDQYYSAMSERVAAFMSELNEELWSLGVPAKTQHYEAAPAQYELAPVFTIANIAVDHNQLVMEMLRKVADRHDFVCLLHEKPFDHVNGSGKHNNWSLSTDTGRNLLKPPKKSEDSLVFLAFFIATIAAVDEYASVLIMSCASLANESRLGGHEAPPAIISVFAGQKILDLFEGLYNGEASAISKKEEMDIGVASLPMLLRDEADRNRTSPFAFTGNKFEFRMCGSSQSLGFPNTVLNTIVAEMLGNLSDGLEKAPNIEAELCSRLRDLLKKHKRIFFNGNNYSNEWRIEAAKRGLPIIENTVDALQVLSDKKIIDVFRGQHVFTEAEVDARRDIGLKSYIKHAAIESSTMLKMSRQKLLPACIKYSDLLARAVASVENTGASAKTHRVLLQKCLAGIEEFYAAIEELESACEIASSMRDDSKKQAREYCSNVVPKMKSLRAAADALEKMVDKEYWPLPSYGEMLFYTL